MVAVWTGLYFRLTGGRGTGAVPDRSDVFLERAPDDPGCAARAGHSHPAGLVVLCHHGPARPATLLPSDGLPAAPVRRRAGGARDGRTGGDGLGPGPNHAHLEPREGGQLGVRAGADAGNAVRIQRQPVADAGVDLCGLLRGRAARAAGRQPQAANRDCCIVR